MLDRTRTWTEEPGARQPFGEEGSVRMEITPKTLKRLLCSGLLHAAEIRCLDCESKECVWRLVALHCAHRLGCDGCCAQCSAAPAGDPSG